MAAGVRRPATTPAPTAAPALSLETRMALTDAAMAVRLDQAALAIAVSTAPHTIGAARAPIPDTYPTPVAALLQRAHHRLATAGWCAGTSRDERGAVCLYGAIHLEARGHTGHETGAVAVLLDAIRRRFPHAESVPDWNDTQTGAANPIRALDEAAQLADARGI